MDSENNVKNLPSNGIKQESIENEENPAQGGEPMLQTRPLFKKLFEYSNEKKTSIVSGSKTSEDECQSGAAEDNFQLAVCKSEPVDFEGENSNGSQGDTLLNNIECIKNELPEEFDEIEVKQEPGDLSEDDYQNIQHVNSLDSSLERVSPVGQRSSKSPRQKKGRTKTRSKEKEWSVELDIPQEIKIGVPDRRHTVQRISEEEASSSFVDQDRLSPPGSSSSSDEDYALELRSSESETDLDFHEEITDSDSDEYSDSDDEEIYELDEPEAECAVEWSDTVAPMNEFPFTKKRELLVEMKSKNPIDFFHLMVSESFLKQIRKNTNENLKRFAENDPENAEYKEISAEEFLVFLAVLYNMGIMIDDYMIANPKWFREQMCLKRFNLILRCIEYKDQSPAEPKNNLAKMRPVINYLNNKMQNVYYPGKELVVDESLIVTRRLLWSRGSLKKRLQKYGLKFYSLTEPNGLTLKFAVSGIEASNFGAKSTTQAIAKHLLKEKLNCGHSIYMHYHFNSVELAEYLLRNNTYCSGMLCKNRPNNPKDIESIKKLAKGQCKVKYANGIAIGKFREALFISTEFDGTLRDSLNTKGVKVQIPNTIANYINFGSKTNRAELLLSCYPCEKNRLPWKTKVLVHVLQILMLNSYLLFNKHSGSKMKYFKYRIDVMRKLAPMNQKPQMDFFGESDPESLDFSSESGSSFFESSD